MASMSVMTSSITSATAAASPSRVSVVKVAPRRYSTYDAAVRVTGTTVTAISAVRQDDDTSATIASSSTRPISETSPR